MLWPTNPHGSFHRPDACQHRRATASRAGVMSMFAIDTGPRRPDAAFSILVEPRPAGATIGLYRGLPIAERVTDQFGRLFAYAGIIGRQRDGQYDVGGLKPGEFIVEPGLVYNLEKGKERPKAAPTPDARGE